MRWKHCSDFDPESCQKAGKTSVVLWNGHAGKETFIVRMEKRFFCAFFPQILHEFLSFPAETEPKASVGCVYGAEQ